MQTVNDLIETLQALPKWAREREVDLRIVNRHEPDVHVEIDSQGITLEQGHAHADCRVCASYEARD